MTKTTNMTLIALDVSADVSSTHKGFEASVTYALPLIDNETLSLIPSCSLLWQSQETIEYYYGVRNSEAGPERAAHSPDPEVSAIIYFGYRLSIVAEVGIPGTIARNVLG